jgi:methylated-DNA-[protein]-cysteine S-methyltransferase
MPEAYRDTAIGVIRITEEDGEITGLYFESAAPHAIKENSETKLLSEAFTQLNQYLSGKRREFELPLRPRGTPFQLKCWAALTQIPYGATASYGEIARRINNPRASRAVGRANNRNPISIFIPCHRVIGADGSLTGYGGGLELKERLLALEQRQ